MPAFGFKGCFVAAVEDGRKRTTIRQRRKDGWDPREGQTAYCYFGLRTKVCRLLRRSPITSVDTIELTARLSSRLRVKVSGRILNDGEIEALARADGFASEIHFRAFFEEQYGLPFKGHLITWSKEAV